MKLDIPASNGFILGTCLWSWIEKNICTGSWNDYCKSKRPRRWQDLNIQNWLKQQLKSRTIWGSKFRHLLNKMIAYWKIVTITRSRRTKQSLKSFGKSSRQIALVRSFRLLFVLWRCHAWITLKRKPHKRIKNMIWETKRIKWELEIYKSNWKTKRSINNAVIYSNPPFRLLNKNDWNNMTKSGGGSDID